MFLGAVKGPVTLAIISVFLLSNMFSSALAGPSDTASIFPGRDITDSTESGFVGIAAHSSIISKPIAADCGPTIDAGMQVASLATNDTRSVPIYDAGTTSKQGGMAHSQSFLMTATLKIVDVPLRYKPPVGSEMIFEASYSGSGDYPAARSQRFGTPSNGRSEAGPRVYQPPDEAGPGPTIFSMSHDHDKDASSNENSKTNAIPTSVAAMNPSNQKFSNLGAGWSFNWVAYLKVDDLKNAIVMVPGGGSEIFKYRDNGAHNTHNPYRPNLTSRAILVSAGDGRYQRRLPDGSIEVYDLRDDDGRFFMTQVIDPQGNAVRIKYDGNFRVSSITDSIGQESRVRHASDIVDNAGFYKIAAITDPFGRQCEFDYDPEMRQLASSTDTIGLVSKYNYDTGTSNISSMLTPYGRSSFRRYTPAGSPPGSRGLQFTYPDRSAAVIENWAGKVNQTYQWSREAMKLYPSDPSDGVHTHCTTTQWLTDVATGLEIPVKEFVKQALENAVTYAYEGQSDHGFTGTSNLPIRISRQVRVVNPDGTVGSGMQVYTYHYNWFGRITEAIDPIGRTITYKYADNNIDLLEKRQTRGTNNELLGTWEYNDKHLPTLFVDGSGQRTRYEYNQFGELTRLIDAGNHVWTIEYDSNGYLGKIVAPLAGINDFAKFTYDRYGRRHTQTDAEGHTLTFDYDDADRLTLTTYNDGSSEKVIYDKLDAVVFKDRVGRETRRKFNSMDQLVSLEDALGRKNQYQWCACGSQSSLIDPAGHVTTWKHDQEGRIVGKKYNDGTTISYEFESGGNRIQSRTDALKQTANFVYNLDDTISKVTYSNTVNPTSTLTATYDSDYPVITALQNDWGTIKYEYNRYIADPAAHSNGAGLLRSASNSSIPNSTVTYGYDESGRVTDRSINGSKNFAVRKYDVIGRITSERNALGGFRFNYGENSIGTNKGTLQLSSIDYPNGLVADFSYNGNFGDERLQEIKNSKASSGVLSQFDYVYDPAGEMTKLKERIDGKIAVQYDIGYDPVGQLKDVVSEAQDKSITRHSYHYDYDIASNRSVDQLNGRVSQMVYNNVNELISLSTRETAGAEKLGGLRAANDVAASPRDFRYDANGNLIDDGVNTYKWDAENRLIQIIYPGTNNKSKFTYNGLGECVKIVETANDKTTSVREFIWSGDEICEERDGEGVLVKMLFTFGENVAGVNHYFTLDHLGSTREITDSTGSVQTRFDYDPLGHPTVLQGNVSATSRYAGYFTHAPSGLNLTHFRAYDSSLGRWLSRDPVGEFGLQGKSAWPIKRGSREILASNLYAYAGNNTIRFVDPLGLQPCPNSMTQNSDGTYSYNGQKFVSNGNGGFTEAVNYDTTSSATATATQPVQLQNSGSNAGLGVAVMGSGALITAGGAWIGTGALESSIGVGAPVGVPTVIVGILMMVTGGVMALTGH